MFKSFQWFTQSDAIHRDWNLPMDFASLRTRRFSPKISKQPSFVTATISHWLDTSPPKSPHKHPTDRRTNFCSTVLRLTGRRSTPIQRWTKTNRINCISITRAPIWHLQHWQASFEVCPLMFSWLKSIVSRKNRLCLMCWSMIERDSCGEVWCWTCAVIGYRWSRSSAHSMRWKWANWMFFICISPTIKAFVWKVFDIHCCMIESRSSPRERFVIWWNMLVNDAFEWFLSSTFLVTPPGTKSVYQTEQWSRVLFLFPFSWFVGYPELATKRRSYEVETHWGILKPTMDPTKRKTYEFLDEFFAEMTKLFPDQYFHIGGDEVEGSEWMSSASVQRFIQEHQLKNKHGLQAYFNKRIQKLLKNYNKSMIGWEEIIEGTTGDLLMDKDAIIHSWKSRGSLIGAVKKGYRGLLSYGYYLDHMWLSRIHYKVNPITKTELRSLSEKQISRVLGGEACMWTEYVSDATLDSRLWPRVLAVAERLWSPATITNEQNLYRRLVRMDRLLEQLHLNFTHRSSYKTKIEALIVDRDQRKDMLHPFTILANCCEPRGIESRSTARRYSTNTSLTTFIDALPSESEFIQELESTTVRYEVLREVFKTWTINDIRLRELFEDAGRTGNRKVWVQDIEQVSANLVHVGRIGLKALGYGRTGVFPPDPNHDMRAWKLSQWISHQNHVLNRLEDQVPEVRLAAVRPVRRLLKAIRRNV